MSRAEIDSFILKFKTVLLSGKKAALDIKSDNGKDEVSLHAELGEGSTSSTCSCPRSRDGPSRQGRRQWRAAAREEKKAANASEGIVAEEVKGIEKKSGDKIEDDTQKDQLCPDKTFEGKVSTPQDKEVTDNDVEKILIIHSEVNQKRDDTERVIEEKLVAVGIKAEKIESVQEK